MGRGRGGRKIEGKLVELEKALHDYHGALNELAAGINVKPPEKPEALVLWHQCQATGLPLVEGGLLDQPHIWLQEVAVIINTEALFRRLSEAQTTSKK